MRFRAAALRAALVVVTTGLFAAACGPIFSPAERYQNCVTCGFEVAEHEAPKIK